MIGYGSEDNHFVIELTYNYGIKTYAMGNDFQVWYFVFFFVTEAVVCRCSSKLVFLKI